MATAAIPSQGLRQGVAPGRHGVGDRNVQQPLHDQAVAAGPAQERPAHRGGFDPGLHLGQGPAGTQSTTRDGPSPKRAA